MRWWPRAEATQQPGQTRPAVARPGAKLELVTRQGCHLCAEAQRLLEALSARLGVPLTVVDVDGLEPADRAALTDRVPVVLVDDAEICQWRVEVAAVERALTDT